MNAKKVIKGIAKTTGKYTLKGLGKGIELTGRGAVKTVNALVKNPQIQKIATGSYSGNQQNTPYRSKFFHNLHLLKT